MAAIGKYRPTPGIVVEAIQVTSTDQIPELGAFVFGRAELVNGEIVVTTHTIPALVLHVAPLDWVVRSEAAPPTVMTPAAFAAAYVEVTDEDRA